MPERTTLGRSVQDFAGISASLDEIGQTLPVTVVGKALQSGNALRLLLNGPVILPQRNG
jgi:hypothetical protein